MTDDLFAACPEPVARYLRELTKVSAVVADAEGYIRCCNEAFSRLFDAEPADLIGLPLRDHLASARDIDASPEGEWAQRRLRVQRGPVRRSVLHCHLVTWQGRLFIFGQTAARHEDDVFNQLSRLNNELSNQSRELAKKNAELQRANRRIEHLLRTDHLTGLANRKHFTEYLAQMVSVAHRHGTSLSLVAADLDHFKGVNDACGHAAGDALLAAVGELLRCRTRREDLAARIGGEEFLVLLVGTDGGRAMEYAERIRAEVAELDVPSVPIRVTASFGVAQLEEGEDGWDLMLRADEALYRSKEKGRDRVTRSRAGGAAGE